MQGDTDMERINKKTSDILLKCIRYKGKEVIHSPKGIEKVSIKRVNDKSSI